ncbi:MAG: hypothetical protein NDF54_10250 [archaeon GB-1867-035]|nr:hypothetical protein [Candidatus Culexmicrobium profundum]
MDKEKIKQEKKLLLLSLEDALPYIAKPAEIKNIVTELLEKIDLINNVIEYFEKILAEERDTEIKTDIRILINALKRRIKR